MILNALALLLQTCIADAAHPLSGRTAIQSQRPLRHLLPHRQLPAGWAQEQERSPPDFLLITDPAF